MLMMIVIPSPSSIEDGGDNYYHNSEQLHFSAPGMAAAASSVVSSVSSKRVDNSVSCFADDDDSCLISVVNNGSHCADEKGSESFGWKPSSKKQKHQQQQQQKQKEANNGVSTKSFIGSRTTGNYCDGEYLTGHFVCLSQELGKGASLNVLTTFQTPMSARKHLIVDFNNGAANTVANSILQQYSGEPRLISTSSVTSGASPNITTNPVASAHHHHPHHHHHQYHNYAHPHAHHGYNHSGGVGAPGSDNNHSEF